MIRKKRRFDYGDYYSKPTTAQAEGTVGQVASPYYTPNNLNSLSVPESQGSQSFFNSPKGQGLGAVANMAASALPQSSEAPISAVEKQNEEAGVAVASALGPWWGALAKVGTTASNYVREDDDVSQAQGFVADTLNPFHQFNSLREGDAREKWTSFLNPVASSHLAAGRKRRLAQEKKLRHRLDIQRDSQKALADYPIYGVGKYGMKFPNGGLLPYPVDNDSEADQLASNVAQYNGATHENGGIDLDVDGDNQAEIEIENKEVIKDDMVLSNRLKPSKQVREVAKRLGVRIKKRETYATLAARLGAKKGEFEEKLLSTVPGERNSAEIMTERLDQTIDMLFMDQQVRKFGSNNSTKFPKGGKIPTVIPKEKAKLQGLSSERTIPAVTNNLNIGFATQREILESGIDPNGLGPQADSTVAASHNWLKRFDPYYKPRFPYGGNIDPKPRQAVTLLPEYLKINPNNSPEQQRIKAEINLNAALQFKNKLSGNVIPQVPIEQADYTGVLRGAAVRDSYNSVDPQFVEKADSTINASRQFLYGPRLNPGIASRKYGGFLPKYRTGDPIGGLRVKDPFTGDFYSNDYSPNLNESPYPASTVAPNIPTPRRFDIGDYKADIAAGIGTIANQIQIGRLETEYQPETVDAPINTYTDRTGFLTNQANQQFRAASQGIQGSSMQDNQALKANLYAKSLSGLSQALDSETQRKDALDSRFSELVNRTNIINTNIRNQGKYVSMDNRNQKRALTQANLDNLVRSYIGNEAARDIKSTEFSRNYLSAARSGDRGVDIRLLNQLPATTRRRLGYK